MLKRLAEEVAGKTVVMITHRERIAGLCSEVVRMENINLNYNKFKK